ncbi:MAG: SpoIIE family protein phosphatase [Cycloclasticus sp.]
MAIDHLLFVTSQATCLESIPKLRQLLSKVTEVSIPQQTTRWRISLCLSEHLSNLVIHAKYATRPTLAKADLADNIHLRFGHNNTAWWLEVLDYSLSWNPSQHRPPSQGEDEPFPLNTGQRGLQLLHEQSDELTYHNAVNSQPNTLRLSWFKEDCKPQPRVLLVEDNPAMRRLYAVYLRDEFDVSIASNGLAALNLLRAEKFDLVLSDISMPQISGLQLREKLNTEKHTGVMPFIFLTASDNNDLKQHACQLGVDDYLVKPVNKAQLNDTLKRVLERTNQLRKQFNDRIDERIRSSLSPSLPPSSHGWNLRVANRNTGGGGGDLLLQHANEKHLTLMLADIMGHDDSAKFFAFAYAGYMRGLTQAADAELTPDKLLSHLSDDAFSDQLLSKTLLTCCIIKLAAVGHFSIACAGHPAPLLISPDGVRALPIRGTLPGLLPNVDYPCLSQQLLPGERLALYTDGLFESAASQQERLELETQITETLHTTLDKPISDALTMSMQVFDRIAGTTPQDDTFLILLEPSLSI